MSNITVVSLKAPSNSRNAKNGISRKINIFRLIPDKTDKDFSTLSFLHDLENRGIRVAHILVMHKQNRSIRRTQYGT